MKTVVIGNGNLGKWHCEKAFKIEEIDFIGLVDLSEEARARFQETYNDIPVYASIDEVIDKIDAAIIVTPISTHYELNKKLIERNIHVFCEKSATESLEQILEISSLLKKKDLVFQVGHSERYHQVWEELSSYDEWLKCSNSSIHINRYGPYRGRDADVSVVEDLLIHDVDLLLHLFGEMPSSLSAKGYKIRSNKWDHVDVVFNFESGRRATVSTGRNHVRVVRDFELLNERGCLYIDLLNNTISVAPADSDLSQVSSTKSYPKRDHLYLEQIDFAKSVLNKEKVSVDIDDAVSAIKVLDKVLESLDKGQEVQV